VDVTNVNVYIFGIWNLVIAWNLGFVHWDLKKEVKLHETITVFVRAQWHNQKAVN
jgi:hypothetical protein